jgi:sugar phosphate isomerase/epimerase
MTPNANRPVIISILQYQDEIAAGTLTVFDLIHKVVSSGVDGIELRREPWKHYQAEAAQVREQLEAQGKFATYATFSTLFSPDDDARKLLLHDIDTAKALGSPLLRIFPGAAPDDLADPAWSLAKDAVEYAASLGIMLALENFGKAPGATMREIATILDAIPHEALQTNIDVGNYATNGEDVVAAIHAVGGRAIYAHLKDKLGDKSDATTHLGGGDMPMHEIMTALEALPQRIIYCFEFAGGGEPDARIQKSLAYLRDFQV